MLLQSGRDKWDFIMKVKDFYYSADIWRNYSRAAPVHAASWFNKLSSTRDLEAMLGTLLTLSNASAIAEHAMQIEVEDTARFRKHTGNLGSF